MKKLKVPYKLKEHQEKTRSAMIRLLPENSFLRKFENFEEVFNEELSKLNVSPKMPRRVKPVLLSEEGTTAKESKQDQKKEFKPSTKKHDL